MKTKPTQKQLEKNIKDLALLMANSCVRNTVIEDYHSGISPHTETGDYSDVKVITPKGEIPWSELSRVNDSEMMALNIEVVDNIYTFLQYLLNPKFADQIEAFDEAMKWLMPQGWNEPQMNETVVKVVSQKANAKRSKLDLQVR